VAHHGQIGLELVSAEMTDFATRRTVMVDTQVRPADVTKFPVIKALLSVPREAYVPRSLREAAYIGENLVIAPRRVVLEARTLAKLLDALDIQPDEMVLDLGCGLGYSTAVIARLAEAVIAVEEDAALAAQAEKTLLQGAIETLPQALSDQLKEGGRVGCVFMEGALGVARVGYKVDGVVTWRFAFNATAPVLPGFELRRGFVL